MSWTWVVVQGEVTGGNCTSMWGERQRMGFMVLEGGLTMVLWEGLIEGFCTVPLVLDWVDEMLVLGSGLPHVTVACRARVTVCAGPLCLLYWVPEGHTFSSLPLAARGGGSATWSIWAVAMGRTVSSAMTVVPVRGTAESVSSMGPAYTALGMLSTSLWDLFASLLASSLLTQGCKVVITTTCVALLILGWAFGVRMGVSALLIVIMEWHG